MENSNKVILILVDGMRPDALKASKNQYLVELAKESQYDFYTQTVMPSCTLPCHFSLFFSVESERHGILSNTFVPLVRPIESLGDVVAKFDKKFGMLYNWEELRDLNKPGSTDFAYYKKIRGSNTDSMKQEIDMTNIAIDYINSENPEFIFLYLGYVDIAGHNNGWLSDEYNSALENAIKCINTVRDSVSDNYNIVITADHGGHERSHGSDIPEDMTIPVILNGPAFKKGVEMKSTSIIDLAPTIAKVLNITKPKEWEGKELV